MGFISRLYCQSAGGSLSGTQMNCASEKVISAASSGENSPSLTSCCMIACACCSRGDCSG
nr:MAG TPA: hypothetical protein [Caudoviricetes sp.]